MLVIGFPAAVFATNCYVVAPSAGEECMVVDPGVGVMSHLSEVLAEHRLRPASVLLTHGHIDHVFSVTPVCGAHGLAAVVHADDRYRLDDPVSTLDPALAAMLRQQFGPVAWSPPDDIVVVGDGQLLDVAGLSVRVVHAPGHTEGSIMFGLDGVPDDAPEDVASTVLGGDVLFAGSIGRTDLPGGDPDRMWTTLRERVLTLADDTLVLPGHGPTTTIREERATNPFLAAAGRR